MTDRELLEFAAKAAGIKLRWHPDGTAYSDTRCSGYWGVWNPITDDGDALRLSVRLKIDVKHYNNHVAGWFDDGDIRTVRIFYEGDPLAATRRAIVMAAAEIGQGIAQKAASTDPPEDNYYKSMAEAEEIGRQMP